MTRWADAFFQALELSRPGDLPLSYFEAIAKDGEDAEQLEFDVNAKRRHAQALAEHGVSHG